TREGERDLGHAAAGITGDSHGAQEVPSSLRCLQYHTTQHYLRFVRRSIAHNLHPLAARLEWLGVYFECAESVTVQSLSRLGQSQTSRLRDSHGCPSSKLSRRCQRR